MVWVPLCGNHFFKLPLVLFLAYRKFSRDVLECLKFTIFQKEVQHLFEHQAAIKSLHKALTSLDVNYIVSKCRFAFIINKTSLKSTEKQLREGRYCSCIDRFYSGQLKQLICYSFRLMISYMVLINLKWQTVLVFPLWWSKCSPPPPQMQVPWTRDFRKVGKFLTCLLMSKYRIVGNLMSHLILFHLWFLWAMTWENRSLGFQTKRVSSATETI